MAHFKKLSFGSGGNLYRVKSKSYAIEKKLKYEIFKSIQ